MTPSNTSLGTSLDRIAELAAMLRGVELRGMPPEKLDELLRAIISNYVLTTIDYDHQQICYRARRCRSADGWPNINNCLNPPAGSEDFGRASLPREPVLYSSWNFTTALDEVGALVGDVVQIVGFNAVGGKTVCHAMVERYSATTTPVVGCLMSRKKDQ